MYLEIAQAWLGFAVGALAAYGVGSLLERFLPESFGAAERLVASCIGGIGVLGASFFVIGLISFRPEVIIAVTVPAAVYGGVVLRRQAAGWKTTVRLDAETAVPMLVVAAVLLVTAIAGSAEVLGGIDHDGISYHLLDAKVWLRDGRIRPVIGIAHTAFPAALEVMFGVWRALGGVRAPGVSAVFTLSLFLATAAFLARRVTRVGPGGAWWCAALLATMPAVYTGAHSAFVDVFYASLILLAARIAVDAARPAHMAMFGLLCGLALATKYTALVAVPLLAVSVVFMHRHTRVEAWTTPWRTFSIFVLAAALPSAAFYIRNAIVLGCPVYPPTPGMLAVCDLRYLSLDWVKDFQDYITVRRGGGYGRDWLALLALPFNLTYRTAHFHGAGGIGLSALAFAPLGAWLLRRRLAAQGLGLLALMLTTAWFFTQQESRFLIHVYAIATCFAVAGWRWTWRLGDPALRWLSAGVVAVSVLYGGAVIVRVRWPELHAVFSPAYAQQRKVTATPHYGAYEFLNAQPGGKVMLMAWHFPAYYLERDFVIAWDGWRGAPRPGVSEDDLTRSRWSELGVEYLLDVDDQWGRYALPAGTPLATLVYEQDGARVYRVNAPR